MSEQVLNDCYVSINGTDMSGYVTSVTLKLTQDIHEKTAMGDTMKDRLLGMRDWSLEVNFNQDYAVGTMDDDLYSVYNGGVAIAVIVRPESEAVSTSNPQYAGNAIMDGYTPIGGSVNEMATTSVNFLAAGTMTRTTS